VGGSVTIPKTVTVTQTSTTPLDLFFLTDTTGSMSGAIGDVRTGFSSIVTAVSGVASNVNYAAGQYKDVGDVFVYKLDQDITASTAAVQTAINGWFASGGGDTPEAGIFGLQQAATTTSWRAGSQRILVWTGDAPSHDPSNGVTQADAIAALLGAGVEVISISANSGPGIDSSGQATAISDATGGSFLGTFSAGNLTTAILDAITTAVTTYSTVDIVPTGLPAGVGVSIAPVSYSGSFDRSIDRTFGFDVTFTGLAPGTYNFSLDARVDGVVIASEADTITVPGGSVPEPSTLLFSVTGLLGVIALRRRFAR
jgi:hypothetical protein